MSDENGCGAIILVINDAEETRDGIEKLLLADGYHILPARHEEDAVRKARRERPKPRKLTLFKTAADVVRLDGFHPSDNSSLASSDLVRPRRRRNELE